MDLTLDPRRYFLVDRLAKLLGLLAVVAGLAQVAGSFSLALVLLGLVIGVAPVFVEVEEDEIAEGGVEEDGRGEEGMA